MDRLTYWCDDGMGGGEYRVNENGTEYSGHFIDRLAAYEDTGLTPEGVFALQTHPDFAYADYIRSLWRDIGGMEHMEVVAKAAVEGRLLVLPCKVGDTVYELWYAPCHNGEPFPDSFGCDGCYDACDIRKEIKEYVVPNVRFILTHFVMNNTRTYFLTREAAEEKLKQW